jgi:hypothetical protein
MPVPPLEDFSSSQYHDGRCRTWTVDHIPDFADLPAYEPGMRSPVLVPLDGWAVNWSYGTLFVFQRSGGERHPDLDGAQFGTAEEAHTAAWAAGLLGLWVYEDVAHEYRLPSSLAWVRSTEDIMTTDAGHDDRKVTDARTVEWCRILDPDRDLTPEAWSQAAGNAMYATFAVSAYGANNPDRFAADDATVEYIEVEYGIIVSLADDDETEVFSHYVYETVAGATDARPEALDGYLTADMQATFRNLGADDIMADCVWNGTVEDTALHLRAAA